MVVADGVLAQRHVARMGVEARGRGDLAGVERSGGGDRLHGRTRFDQVGHGAVAVGVRLVAADRVGVVAGQVDHRQHLAAGHVQHHHRTAAGLVRDQRIAQLAVGQELDPAVDAQGQVLARLGGTDQVDVLHHAAVAVADHPLAAGLAAQPLVEGQLQPFLAAVVDVGEAQHVRHRLALRVEAAELALRGHARHVEGEDGLGLVGVDPALEVDEFLVGALREPAHQLVVGRPQRARQLRDALGMGQQLLRVAPHRFDRGRYRHRLAVAVGDHAARGRDRQFAHEPRLALALVEIGVDQLHPGRAAGEDQGANAQGHADQQHAPAQVECAAVAVAARRAAHGRTTTMSSASGNFIPNFCRATWSIRLAWAQVACSSCRRPNSMFSSSRSRSARVSSTNSWRWR